MALSFTDLLKQAGSSLLNAGTNTLTSRLLQPQNLVGAGLLTGGLLSDKEPGEVGEARQFLRNRFTSPNALSQQFSSQIGGLSGQFQPLLDQQRNRDIEGISQRFAAAFPSRVGAQGPEFGTLARYITDEALPREQSLLGNLGLRLMDTQGDAAKTILQSNQANPFSQLASVLGYDLLTRGSDGTSLLNAGNLTNLPGTSFGGTSGTNSASQAVLSTASTLLGSAIGGIGRTAATGQVELLDQAGSIIGYVSPNGDVASITKGTVGNVSQGAAGQGGLLASPVGTALGAVGAGAGGFFAGRAVGDLIERPGQSNQFQTTAAGGLSGAAAGAAIGSVIPGIGTALGAAIGGLAGLFGGFGAERRREDAQKAQETSIISQQRPQAISSIEGMLGELNQLKTKVSQFTGYDGGAMAANWQIYGGNNFTLPKDWIPGANEIPHAGAAVGRIADAITRINYWLNTDSPGAQAIRTTNELGHFGPMQELIRQEYQIATELSNRLVEFGRARGAQGV